MLKVSTLILLLHVITASYAEGENASKNEGKGMETNEGAGSENPLFLTPCIDEQNATKKRECRDKGKVKAFAGGYGVREAYSGYITVNKTCPSHLFFLLVKAKNDAETAPLILWLQGGPGTSSLFGQFLENGPVGIDANGSLYERSHTLAKDFNVLYLDQPVGAGYSFTNSTACYSKSLKEVTDNIEDFLRKFLKLFPEYKGRSFHAAGESYGVRPAIALAHRLQQKDESSKVAGSARHPNLTLSGVICGVGFFGPLLSHVDITEYLRHMGLLDANSYTHVQSLIEAAKLLIGAHMPELGLAKLISILPLLEQLTGMAYTGNILQALEPREHERFNQRAKGEFKALFHVGDNATFSTAPVMEYLVEDIVFDISGYITAILDAGYKFLVYNGQLDRTFSSANAEAVFKSMSWKGSAEFKTVMRDFWYLNREDTTFVGYLKQVDNLVYADVLGAGHFPGFDRTEAVYDLTRRFIKGEAYIVKNRTHEFIQLVSLVHGTLTKIMDDDLRNSKELLGQAESSLRPL